MTEAERALLIRVANMLLAYVRDMPFEPKMMLSNALDIVQREHSIHPPANGGDSLGERR